MTFEFPNMIGDKLTVVVAEDHAVQRRYLCHLVSRLGHEAIPACDGTEGLRLVQEHAAEVLISDLNMPGLNGLELTRAIRKLDLGRYVHVFMLTGQDEAALRKEALFAGVDDFMSKQPEQATLMARIRAAERLIKHERELAEKNRALQLANDLIEKDIRAAAIAQRSLLPPELQDLSGVRVFSSFVPSSIVSGDMFGIYQLEKNCIGFYVVDVSGHGVEASLLSVAIGHLITPEYFAETAIASDGSFDPASMVSRLNERFCKEDRDQYFTMFCGLLDTQAGLLTFTQAGCPSPYLVEADGLATCIGAGGFPVAMLPGIAFSNETVAFAVGTTLVICSDAAIEAENAEMEPFGSDRLRSELSAAKKGEPDCFSKTVTKALQNWRDGRSLEDDLTIIALERTAENDPNH